jgi:hypothetical protein
MGMQTLQKHASLVALFGLVLSACGGGSSDTPAPPPPPSSGTPPPISSTPPPPPPAPPPPAPAPTTAQRTAAATATATANALCNAVRPFYWEIGDRTTKLASGSVGTNAPVGSDTMPIASASKWVYGAYVTELRGNAGLRADDLTFLTFRSGYSQMGALSCTSAATVDTCLGIGTNGFQDPNTVGKFFYNGGHMQRHAHDNGLGPMNATALTTEVQNVIGNFGFIYASPQPPGGINTSADGYASFLRAILSGQLRIASQLGANAVCTNPSTCPTASYTPVPGSESWHYSIGHWVEDDPSVGDGAFSSPGLFGFYPWIDGTKTWYGVLARQSFASDQGYASAQCGRLIRKAWATAVTQ